jgi:Flp pilus assembly secretin CpaC
MTASCVPGRMAKCAPHWLAAAVVFAAVAAQTVTQAFAQPPLNETILVRLDQAALFKVPDSAATLVIGNPLIADVAIQPGGIAVVTGKGYGGTNVVVLDRGGVVLMEKELVVTTPRDHVVVVYRGTSRETYSCTPDCSARITLGDNPDWFDKVINQAVTRTTQAMSAGANGGPPGK